MKNLKQLTVLLIFIFAFSQHLVQAQVSGISYTISPTIDHNWWDDKAGIDDGFIWGGKLGLGFGENFELRGSYMKSTGLKTNFNDFGFPNFSDSLYTPRKVDVTRYGGEMKINISKGKLLPFLTLGTGVQSTKLDTFAADKKIYVNAGLGVKLSVGDRYTLTLEGKNTMYNFNAVDVLMTQQERETQGIVIDDYNSKGLSNWSLGASLQFYIGGRRPGQMTELDKAYYDAFAKGFQGLRIPLEPSLARMNFNDNLPYRDAWMGGGYAGIDFGPYVGIRGFYLRAMQNDEINLDFDKLAMYGGEIRTRMNLTQGITPILMLGGGYLNVDSKYVPKDSVQAESQAFALGGLGLSLPLSDRFNIYGGVRAILTSGSDPEKLQSTDEIQTSWMYGVGLKLILGKKANAPDALFKTEADAALAAQQALNEEEKVKIKAEAAQLKTDYETKVIDLESKLNEAYAQQDIEAAAQLLQEKEQAEQVVAELEKREAEQDAKDALVEKRKLNPPSVLMPPSSSLIQMTPAEFQNLIEEILENMGSGGKRISPTVEQQMMGQQSRQQLLQQQEMDRRMGEMEKLLIQMSERQQASGEVSKEQNDFDNSEMRRDLTEFSAKLLAEMQKMNAKVDANAEDIKAIRRGEKPASDSKKTDQGDKTEVNVDINNEVPSAPMNTVTEGNTLGVKSGGDYITNDSSFFSKLTYEGMSGFSGFNLGGQTTFNVGFRWHYGIGDSRFELMPEAFFGFGSPSAFGLTVNGVLPMPLKNTPVTPYIGVGAGFMQIAEDGDDKLRLNYNAIFGTYLKVWKGRVYVDFTARNLFKYNQIIAGYRFNF